MDLVARNLLCTALAEMFCLALGPAWVQLSKNYKLFLLAVKPAAQWIIKRALEEEREVGYNLI